MDKRIKNELSIGLSDETMAALKAAAEFEEIKLSHFGRAAIKERLVALGYLHRPEIRNYQNGEMAIKPAE